MVEIFGTIACFNSSTIMSGITRREFMIAAGSSAIATLLASCGFGPEGATIPTTPDYFAKGNEKERNALVSEMADLLVSKTGLSSEKAKFLKPNWFWATNELEYQKFAREHPDIISSYGGKFNAATDMKSVPPLTFVDLTMFETYFNEFNKDQKTQILKQIVIHEMEHRAAYQAKFNPLKKLENGSNPLYVMATNGFLIQFDTKKFTGLGLDEAAAETSSKFVFDSSYIHVPPPDRHAPTYQRNLASLLTALKISNSELLDYHRNHTPFEFGSFVANKCNYGGTDGELVGLTLAMLASEGRSEELKKLATDSKIKLPDLKLTHLEPQSSHLGPRQFSTEGFFRMYDGVIANGVYAVEKRQENVVFMRT